MSETLRLIPGRFYRSYDQNLWCCYKVDGSAPTQAQARCVRVKDSRLEYFYIDGRYDEEGKREHTLIEDMSTFWESLQLNQKK